MKKIIMIVGAGRSGSTLLDKALGSHSHCYSLGEIVNLNQELRKADNTLCACSSFLKNCPFWNDIIQEIKVKKRKDLFKDPDALSFKVQPIYNKLFHRIISYLKYFFILVNLKQSSTPNIQEAVMNTAFLYRLIFSKTNAQVLIDSSKNLIRALILESQAQDFSIFYIHLIRDGRAVLHSTQKGYFNIKMFDENEKKLITKTIEEKKTPPEEAINSWVRTNLKIHFALSLFRRSQSIRIRYEDFANNPRGILTKICAFIGIEYEDEMLELGKRKKHMIGGNPSRINATEIRAPSLAWREELDKNLLNRFNKKAGIVNRFFRYR